LSLRETDFPPLTPSVIIAVYPQIDHINGKSHLEGAFGDGVGGHREYHPDVAGGLIGEATRVLICKNVDH
jgi:hypothetical protein